jgi:hypothetical protein
MTSLNGGPWKLIAEFTEAESGKRSDRPEGSGVSRFPQVMGLRSLATRLGTRHYSPEKPPISARTGTNENGNLSKAPEQVPTCRRTSACAP